MTGGRTTPIIEAEMIKKSGLYFYLALACFLAILGIFIFDGYLGVYDTLFITTGDYTQKIDPGSWSEDYPAWGRSTTYGESLNFRYEIENRRFSGYQEEVVVSLAQGEEKGKELLYQEIEIDPFATKEISWVLDTSELEPASPQVGYREYVIIITRGEVERRVMIPLTMPP